MSELRKDPITGRWVIVASERGVRPSDFHTITTVQSGGYCPFCPGNEAATPREILSWRSHGTGRDEPGWSVRVVPNKFPALHVEGSLDREGEGLYDRMNGIGAHEVIIETPRHEATLAQLSVREIEEVFWAYRERIVDLKRDRRFEYILVFKNHGPAAGATLEHEHSQLIALPIVPREPRAEIEGAARYHAFRERCVFCDVIRQDRKDGSRIVFENDRFVALCPYASRTPFQTWILPKVHRSHFETIKREELASLAEALRLVLRKIDKALEHPSYNLMLQTSPLHFESSPSYHWRLEIAPSLTRIGGFEWGSGFFINPTPPEEAASFLRKLEL
ncbi:galactose-1-phosphate uridylyltransferase [Vulgatibacter sp.]|uniref:galactose-1-phosphate uridylyltransferase n=1 Tax=Vulgatibacter sp. TaxID=1971226 RepID=UPI0035671D9A